MSITVRLWNTEELEAIETGKDKWLATVFMNGHNFSGRQLSYYPYSLRREYLCEWHTLEGQEPVTIYATDQRMLLKFIDAEYTRRPDSIYQVITQFRPIAV